MDQSPPQPAILFVLNRLARGGMEQMTVLLARTLQRRGRYRPVIACLAEPGPLADEAIAAGIPLHSGLLHHKFDRKVVRRLRRLMAGDIVGPAAGPVHPVAAAVIVNPGGDRMFWTSLARGKRRPGSPALVLWAHSTPRPGRRIIEPLNRPFVRRLDAVAVLGPRQAEAYARLEKLPADRMHQVPNGLGADRLARLADRSGRDGVRGELGAAADDVVVMCVANLRPVKRVELFCRAAAALLGQPPAGGGQIPLRFWLVGDGPGREQLAGLLADPGWPGPPGFVWLGERADLEQLWPAADVGVCCSDSEGLSVSMLEAMAAGAAFVSTDVGEHPTLIEPEQTGLLIEPGDANALAGAVAQLASDGALRGRLASAAGDLVRTRYTADHMADEFERMLGAATGPVPPSR